MGDQQAEGRSEEDLLPISALQHLLYCERQCALIHLEGIWDENRWTAEGHVLHEKVHGGEAESRGDRRLARGVRLRSLELGLVGVADMVEFVRVDEPNAAGVAMPGARGLWRPVPVEYKRGGAKAQECDEVQLCAQGICLEEMLHVPVTEGALYYGKVRRRRVVRLDEPLRRRTRETVARLGALLARGETPPAVQDERCARCSLRGACLPSLGRKGRRASAYFEDELQRARGKLPGEDP